MGILETRHGIITESVHLIFVRFPKESSKKREPVWFIFYSFHPIYFWKRIIVVPGTVSACQYRVSSRVSCL